MHTRFRTRVLIMIGAIVLAVGIATSVAVLSTMKNQSLADATQQLTTGARVLDRALQTRAEMLSGSVATLTADFGFRQAVATGENETISLTLLNHGGRIGADISAVVGLDGAIVSTTDEMALHGDFPYADLLRAHEDGLPHTDVVLLDGRAYQLVVAPIYAPQQIGWASIGFEIDQSLVDELSELTGLEIAIVSKNLSGRPTVISGSSQSAAKALALDQSTSDWMSQATTLSAFDAGGIEALLQVSLVTILSGYYRLRQQLLVIFGFSLFVSGIVSMIIARRISHPLSQLVHVARKIRRGDYSAKVAVGRNDEFGVLADTLDEMREGIAERESRITYQLHHDALTGMPNEEAQRREMKRRIEAAVPFSVIHLRIDRFTEINEALGSQFGDQLLGRISRRLMTSVDDESFVIRRGEHRFGVLTERVSESAVDALVMQIRNALEVPLKAGNVIANVMVAAGISSFPQHGASLEKLIRRADIALSGAASQASRYAIYQAGQEEEKRRRLSIVNDLKTAIENDQLYLLYQPKVNVDRRECLSVEALVRWEHPRYGYMRPDEFIEIAEQAGLIGLLTRWLIKTAAAQAAQWQSEGHDLSVAINLSALDLMNPELPALCCDAVNANGVKPEKLVLEITESAVMEDPETAIGVLNRLHELGFNLAIDDFGTGHSSMAQLANLPVNQLKIDKSFVQAMETDEKALNIVRSMLSLAKSMDLRVVAEGVETLSMWQTLEELGCDDLQGYLFSRPIRPGEIDEWLQKRLPTATTGIFDLTGTTRVANAI